MNAIETVILATYLAGLGMAAGALVAVGLRIGSQLRHGIVAFGGGALLSAVALVLVPDGVKHLTPLSACVWLTLGGFAFMWLDIVLSKNNTPAGQLAAMLSDFIPESMALGAAFALGGNTALLLAALIALQNIPEGFSAYRELNRGRFYKPAKLIMIFGLMALLGPLAGAFGFFFLAEHESVLAAIMLFASGGILYSIFQDIAPDVRLENHRLPPIGAVLGFMLGMLGYMII